MLIKTGHPFGETALLLRGKGAVAAGAPAGSGSLWGQQLPSQAQVNGWAASTTPAGALCHATLTSGTVHFYGLCA